MKLNRAIDTRPYTKRELRITAKSVKGVKRAASKHVKALLKTLGAK